MSDSDLWQTYALTDLAHYHNGYAFKPDDWRAEGTKIIRIEQLNKPNGRYDYFSGDYPNVNHIEDGDLIFSWSATLKVVIWKHGCGVLNQHLFRVDEKEGFDRHFLYHLLDFHMDALSGGSHGSTMKHIKRGELQTYKVKVPPLPVQKRIAQILNSVDNQIDATQALIDKYTAIKQGMMADLFSRGINPETKALRPTFEEAPELYHKTPLGMLPKEWNVKTLGDISEKITSGSRDWAKFYSSEGDLFVRISNLTREHVNFRWNSVKYVNIGGGSEGERTQLQPGDILVSITADLGIVGVVPEDMGRAYINQHTALIRLSTDGENARFVGNYLSSRRGQEQFEKNNDSGAKAGINLPTIALLRCPIPEEKEQILIASKIDALDEVIADLKREKSKSISLKQGLMQDLLTGKVSVPA